MCVVPIFVLASRRRNTICALVWSSDGCSSDLDRMRQRLVGGRVLVSGVGLEATSVEIEDGVVTGIGGSGIGDSGGGSGGGSTEIDVGGALVLPGIVDFHGDAFERQLMPRPGVRVPVDIALLDTDAPLVAAGITTAFHGITCSWEPGLRSVDTMRALFDGFARLGPALLADHRVHLRYEAANLDAVDELCDGLANGRIDLLALNDNPYRTRVGAGKGVSDSIGLGGRQ